MHIANHLTNVDYLNYPHVKVDLNLFGSSLQIHSKRVGRDPQGSSGPTVTGTDPTTLGGYQHQGSLAT